MTRTKDQAKGQWRESWSNQSLPLTSVCEIHSLWTLAHCWWGDELCGYADERRPGYRAVSMTFSGHLMSPLS